MTYTSNYQSQTSAGSSIYSPFNKSAQAQNVPKDYGLQSGPQPGANTNPAMRADSFAPSSPEDIDRLSSGIDAKIARIRQAFSQAPQAAAPPAAAVSQGEIQWAMELEAKVKQGHQPNPQETAQYEDIAKRLQAQQNGATAPPAPAAAVSQGEIQWAMELEAKVKQGHQPNPQETAQYEDIAKRLQAQQSGATAPPAPAAAVNQGEIQWAMELEAKVKQGHQPNPQETAQYEDIAKRLQAQQNGSPAPAAAPAGGTNWSSWSKPFAPPQTPHMPQPINGNNGQPMLTVPSSLRGAPPAPGMQNVPTSLRTPPAAAPQQQPSAQFQNVAQQEIQWAIDLEAKVKQGYQPSPQETAQYNNIAQRMQAGVSQAPPQQQPQTMRPPQAIPQAPAPQAAPQGTAQFQNVAQQEIQWAIDLEAKVKQGYQPSPQETAQYNNIAQRMQAGMTQGQPQPAPQYAGQQQPVAPAQQQPSLAGSGVSQQEVQWAIGLEAKVKQGYQPNPQETGQYNNIAQRLQAGAQPQAAPQYQQPGTQPVQIVPQNYPHVQQRTPQMVIPPQQQLQKPLYGQTQAPPRANPFPAYNSGTPGTPPQANNGMPAYQPLPGQQQPQGPQTQSPGITDRLKNAWSALWG